MSNNNVHPRRFGKTTLSERALMQFSESAEVGQAVCIAKEGKVWIWTKVGPDLWQAKTGMPKIINDTQHMMC